MKAQARQYTIRGVPAEVDRVLRERASRKGRSLNQEVIEELVQATASETKKSDFSEFCGTWEPDPEFDDMIAWQRRIDPEDWK